MPELNELLVQLQIDLGYEHVDKAGTCQGFEMMGLLAFLCRDEHGHHQLPRFHERNNYIIAHRNFAEEIAPVLAKLKTRNKILEDQKVLTPEEQQKFDLTPAELDLYEHYIDIHAYLDCMRLFQEPKVYHEIFGEKLNQSNLILIAQLAQSLMMEDQNGPVLIGSLTGVYTRTEITEMIGQFRHLLNTNAQDGIFSIGSGFHALGVCYEVQQKEWHLINANKHHMAYPCYTHTFPSQLDKLMAEFIGLESEVVPKTVLDKDPNHLFLLGLDIIASEQHAKKMRQVFEEFKMTPAYENAHVLTKKKVEYKDKNGFGLLDMAIRHKEVDTFYALRNFLNKGSDRKVLNKAAKTNSPEIIDALGTEGVNLNQELIPFNFGMIAHEAARNGNLQMLKVIDKHHGDLNQKDLLRRTPLELAKKNNRIEVIKFLESVHLRDKLFHKINAVLNKNNNENTQQLLEALHEHVSKTWEAEKLTQSVYEDFVHELSEIKAQNSDRPAKYSSKLFKMEEGVDSDQKQRAEEEEENRARSDTISPSFTLKTPRDED